VVKRVVISGYSHAVRAGFSDFNFEASANINSGEVAEVKVSCNYVSRAFYGVGLNEPAKSERSCDDYCQRD
jgi:hypothetical protein